MKRQTGFNFCNLVAAVAQVLLALQFVRLQFQRSQTSMVCGEGIEKAERPDAAHHYPDEPA